MNFFYFYFLVEETLEIKAKIRLNLNWSLKYCSLYFDYMMFDII